MASKTALARLRKEYRGIMREPPQHITARPLPSNMLNWYFVLEGPPGSLYAGGRYLGRLAFPPAYPFKPPAVYMITPQGRFKTETKLCLSMSDFHPETWNPLWSVGAVLTGLLTFMLLDEDTVGSIHTTTAEKRALAKASHTFNRTHKVFKEVFPEYVSAPPPASSASGAGSSSARQPDRAARRRANGSMVGAGGGVGQRGDGTNAERTGAEGGVNAGGARGREQQNDKESLPSLLAWLVVFLGVIFYIFRLIASP